MYASEVIIALVVVRALVSRFDRSGTSRDVGIPSHSTRTLADVATTIVYAVSTVSAWIVSALVHVHATVLRISLVASLTHALRWIARRAFGVYTAGESVAGICKENINRIKPVSLIQYRFLVILHWKFLFLTYSCTDFHQERRCRRAVDTRTRPAVRTSRWLCTRCHWCISSAQASRDRCKDHLRIREGRRTGESPVGLYTRHHSRILDDRPYTRLYLDEIIMFGIID